MGDGGGGRGGERGVGWGTGAQDQLTGESGHCYIYIALKGIGGNYRPLHISIAAIHCAMHTHHVHKTRTHTTHTTHRPHTKYTPHT